MPDMVAGKVRLFLHIVQPHFRRHKERALIQMRPQFLQRKGPWPAPRKLVHVL